MLALTSIIAQAQIPTGYYDNAVGKTGDELKIALHDIIDGHTTISYGNIWNAFWSTDNKGNGVVWDMYSDIPNGTPPYTYQMGQNQCGEYEQEGNCYNREHSWPKSWFSGGEDGVPGRDLHHIFATDGYVNAQRSSYPYGEVNNATWTSQNGSKLGSCKSSLGYTGTVFEPIDEYKGDFARAIMYMSVRYYSEDSDWGSSGMTNKSVIKDWAIQMLMRWNEQDPVSAKEIARNNVIYSDYQHNRNPFIDHPEYARAIWDPNWHGVEYSISYSTVQHGSISGPSTAVEGSMVTLTATPAEGYMIGSWSVYKTGDTSTTVSVNSDGSFIMPAFNVTVSANFVVNNTYYSITCANVQHGSISTSVSSARSGKTITLTATPSTGYSLYSWYVYKTGDVNTMVYHGTANTFTMPAFDVTVRATFVQPSSYNYVKVTSAPSDWSGEYILVYENSSTEGYVWTGVDEENCYSEKSINSNAILDDGMVSITVASMTNGYSIKVNGGTNNGKYIYGKSGENKLLFGTSASLNTIEYLSNSVKITSNTSVMRFNNTTGQKRFRYFKSSTYTDQQPIQLYKKTGNAPAPTHTIHFDSNGGNGTMSDQTVNEYEPSQLNTNGYQYTGHVFMGWNTQADGSGQYYTDGATVSLLDDLTLYAQWKQIFTITLASIQNGSVTVSQNQAVEGDLISLTATPATGYEFDHWNVTDALNNSIPVIDNEFEMPASNVTVNVVFDYVGVFSQQYHLVTNVNQLVAGRTYLIVNTAAGKALGTTQNNNNRAGVAVSISNNVISSIGSTVCELTLGGSTNAWTFFDAGWGTNGGYLYASSSSSNIMKTQANNDANGLWSITIDSDGTATIVAQGTNTRNNLRYNPNNDSPIFSCYASSSTMAKVELFIRSEEYEHAESETIANLFPFDKHTVASGATLTITGTTTCNDANHLVLEDGAQFIHHSDNVKATIKKGVEAYTTDGGWYTIATPFTTYTPTEITSDNYDLYALDESADLEWVNYKAHTNDFSMASGAGYLYAHNPGITLRMTGTLNNGDFTKEVTLSYASDDENIKGFNLLGNPTAHDISFTKTTQVADGYYYLSNNETWQYTTSNSIPAGRGILVKTNAAGQTVTLNPQSKSSDATGQYLCVAIDDEKAYIKMNDGVSMPLFALNGKSSNLYLTHEGKPYIMLVRDGAHSVDLNYQPRKNGTHTLTVSSTSNCQLPTLNLVDRLTGAHIDLLATPSYSFESTGNDYASRFELVFSANENENKNEIFAFISNGNIIVNGTGTLQIIDALGRELVRRDLSTLNSQLSTLNYNSGVYLLRLITPEETKVQKLFIN